MNTNDHIVKKISVELQMQPGDNTYALQERCAGLVRDGLSGELDNFLSGYFSPGELIRINKVEIDIGDIAAENIEKEFVSKCMTAFSKAVKKTGSRNEPRAAAVKIDEDENNLEQFFYFLSTGKMAWTNSNTVFSVWQQSVTISIEKKSSLFRRQFGLLVMEDPGSIERLLMQFDDAFVINLVVIYRKNIQADLTSLASLWSHHFQTEDMLVLRNYAFNKFIKQLFSLSTVYDAAQTEPEVQQLRGGFINGAGKQVLPEVIKIINGVLQKIKHGVQPINMNAANEDLLQTATASKTEDKIAGNKKGETGNDNADESIFIDNAGLIILHPFLQNFFTAGNFIENDQFKNERDRQRAVHLLEYMVQGREHLPEYMLTLNKILCGMADEVHIDRFIKLAEPEKNEATALLESVIGHWKVLGNTSIEGLQQTFIQRKGKLSFKKADNYWLLQVEKKAVDILMDKLPWSISYIQLPWMKYLLLAEWT